MKKSGLLWGLCVTSVLIVFLRLEGKGQQLEINTAEIEPLIREWNFANNSRSLNGFENVYAENLLFYTQRLSKSKAIALKRRLYSSKPNFKQRISTSIRYTAYTSGVIKCDFTKEVLENSRWKKYPSYLLVSYERNRYWIVGESDTGTDRTLKYNLVLGRPMEIRTPSANNADSITTPDADSAVAATQPVDSFNSQLTNADTATLKEKTQIKAGGKEALSSILAPFTSMEMVAVPKAYIFALMAILAVGALMIFVADSLRNRRRRSGKTGERDAAENALQNFKTQSAFESFVITLFDPLYFRYGRPKVKRVFAGKVAEAELEPDLEFEFHQKETRARFAIQCLYRYDTDKNEIRLFPHDRIQQYRKFESERDLDLYYVIGIGGTPDDPKALYLIPAKTLRSEVIKKEELKPWRKYGMFFYNAGAGKLQ